MVEQLGRYELVRRIGSGGMAEVFLARLQGVEGFSRQLVIKRMKREIQHHREAVRMFLDEARLCAKLHHPQIVQVFDLGEADGSYFIAMEYVDGPHLGRLARDCWRAGKPPPIVLGAYIVHRAADGLHFAHEMRDPETGEDMGVVHRDVTPHNILLSRFGDVKVADFGVAKALGQAENTRTGVIKGKLSYLSPEQVLGEELDRRSDVFSLGIVLFEVITGRRLFKDRNEIATLQRISREDAPPPSAFNPAIDKELDAICLKALARHREQRFSSMRAFERALEGWITARETKHLKTTLAQFLFQHGQLPAAPNTRETPPAVADLPDPDLEATEIDARSAPRDPRHLLTEVDSGDAHTGEGTAVTLSLRARERAGEGSGISLNSRALSRLKTNLPPTATRFVGRASDLERIEACFDDGARLVTLHGSAGTGKTRLAARYAETCVRRLSEAGGGAFLCDLTDARSVDGIATAVASALGVPLVAGDDTVAAVGRVLAGRGALLLLLDNFEQVVELGPDTVGRWLAGAPEVLFLVTSRELLRLPAEHTLAVEPLGLPTGDANASSSEAVALFLDRARAASPGWVPAEGELEVIADIVRSLDGLPLAIELAAARIRVLKPKQLKERLSRRFDVLKGGARDARPRQATLKSALDWSWELLSETERQALMQCSVFRGGFFLEAAEAVLRTGDDEAPWTLDLLQALRDKSLLRAYDAPDLPEEARFGMLESIREYARERLQAEGGGGEACVRHADYYLERAERWSAAARGRGGERLLARLRVEAQNLLAVHERALGGEGPSLGAEHALKVAVFLEPLYDAQGPRQEQVAVIDAAVEAAGEEGDPLLRVRALGARGRARRRLGRIAECRRDFALALKLARGAGDVREEGRVLRDLGILASDEGRLSDALRNYEDALSRHRQAGDARDEAVTLAYLAFHYDERGRTDDARRTYESSLARLRAAGDRQLEALALGNYASLLQGCGSLAEARELYEEALGILAETKQPTFAGPFLGSLATLLHEQGNLEAAVQHFERALAGMRETGNLRYEGLMLGYLAAALAELGEVESAQRALAQAERRSAEVGDPRHVFCARLHGGFLEVARAREARRAGDDAGAAATLARVDALMEEAHKPLAGGASAAEQSDEVRRTLRLLKKARAARATASQTAPA